MYVPPLTSLSYQDPVASIKYYEERYGMKLVDVYHTPALGLSNYYLVSLRDGEAETWPVAGTAEVSGIVLLWLLVVIGADLSIL